MHNIQFANEMKKIITNVSRSDLSSIEIEQSTSLIDDLGFDSISIIELIVAVEKEYQITFDDNHLLLEALDNFGALSDYVQKSLLERECVSKK